MTEQEIDSIAETVVKKMKNLLDFGVEQISVETAAKIMGKSSQFIRISLQRGNLPIGTATKLSENAWTYYISPKLFYEYTGVRAHSTE